MLLGYVSDESYAALSDVAVEFLASSGDLCVARSAPSGWIHVEIPAGRYEVCLSKPGYGSKRVDVDFPPPRPVQFRLLADRLLGYAWPKWCKAGDRVEFRIHAVEP